MSRVEQVGRVRGGASRMNERDDNVKSQMRECCEKV